MQSNTHGESFGLSGSNHVDKKRLLCFVLIILSLSLFVSFASGTIDNDLPSEDHFVFMGRDCGHNAKLKGNVNLLCVFVNDSQSIWNDSAIDEMYRGIWKDTAYLENKAAQYGVYLKFTSSYQIVTVPADQESRWLDYLMEDIYRSPDHDLAAIETYYQQYGGYDENPMLFFFNKPGRCYSYAASKPYYTNAGECAVYYPSTMSDDRSIAHELFHLFGAIDYYYPERVKEAAEICFPDSAMLIGGREVDDLTAYLIGWSDSYHFSYESVIFLIDIASVTNEEYYSAPR